MAAPGNDYDDLAARIEVADDLLERLRGEGVLYDRSSQGEFFQIPTEAFVGRFSLEIVQRRGPYAGPGEANAPAFLAAQARRQQAAVG